MCQESIVQLRIVIGGEVRTVNLTGRSSIPALLAGPASLGGAALR
ncbi:hypothetical protein [Methanoculleus formosensis]|nr:hypothetical protein [Methanoculleus sp. Afa-1]